MAADARTASPVPDSGPMARGEPGCGFTRPWSVYGWIDGEPAAVAPVHDLGRLAEDLAGFLIRVAAGADADGRAARGAAQLRPWWARVGLRRRDACGARRRWATGSMRRAAREVWEAALDLVMGDGPDLWVHGDMAPSNFLVRNDRLCGGDRLRVQRGRRPGVRPDAGLDRVRR